MSAKVDNRRLEIVKRVQSEGKAEVAVVARALGVTTETIRSDFDYLPSHGRFFGYFRTL